jgi:predicted ribosomally synthesized peptide with nif11-like leader
MLSKSMQTFNDKVAADQALQTKLRSITSPLGFLALAKSEGLDLTGQDFQILVQQAYQQHIDRPKSINVLLNNAGDVLVRDVLLTSTQNPNLLGLIKITPNTVRLSPNQSKLVVVR